MRMFIRWYLFKKMISKKILIWLGLWLILDSIISIYYASIGNITFTLPNWDFNKLLIISQLVRLIRLGIGIYIINNSKNLKYIGIYLIIDGIVSIMIANEFNSWDDWLRIIRVLVGIYLFRSSTIKWWYVWYVNNE